jgi:hypothetical protein
MASFKIDIHSVLTTIHTVCNTSGLLSSNDYGVYHVQLILVNAIGKHTEDMALYYEEHIVFTQVNNSS